MRYYNYAIQEYKNEENFWLLYLQKTTENHTEDDLNVSCGINQNFTFSDKCKTHVLKITYETDILNWLLECLKYMTNLPILRETTNQYIYLIKNITNQSNLNIMSENLLNLIASNKDYIAAINVLYTTLGNCQFKNLKIELVQRLCKNIELVAKENNLIFNSSVKSGIKKESFIFYKADWKYCICFEFVNNDFKDLDVGIRLIDESNLNEINSNLYESIKDLFSKYDTDNNPSWIAWERFSEWNGIPWSGVATKDAESIVFSKVEEIIHYIDANENINMK